MIRNNIILFDISNVYIYVKMKIENDDVTFNFILYLVQLGGLTEREFVLIWLKLVVSRKLSLVTPHLLHI